MQYDTKESKKAGIFFPLILKLSFLFFLHIYIGLWLLTENRFLTSIVSKSINNFFFFIFFFFIAVVVFGVIFWKSGKVLDIV